MRSRSIDVGRAIAIIAIVVGHVVAGVRTTGQIVTPTWTGEVMPAMYLVHIVVFAFVAGLFVETGVSRSGVAGYLMTRAALLGWLYVLWSVLQRGVRVVTNAGNAETSALDLARLWVPEGQLWFLPWLLAATVLVVALRPWTSRWAQVGLLTLTGVLGWFAWGWEPVGVVIQGIALTPVFVLGVIIGGGRLIAWLESRPVAVLAAVLCGLAAIFAWVVLSGQPYADPTAGSVDRSVGAVSRGILGSASGTASVLLVSALVARLPLVARPLAFLGRRSLEIFLAHIVATAGTRVILLASGVHSAGVHVALGTAAGVIGPLVAWWVARQLGWSWLFGLPAWAVSRLAPERLRSTHGGVGG